MPNTLRVVRSLPEKLVQYDSGNIIAQQHFREAINPFLSLKLVGANPARAAQATDPVFASGQATITYVLAGHAVYEDSTGKRGLLKQGDVSWVLSGSGMWSRIEPTAKNYFAIELRVALAPALENSPPQSAWLDAGLVERQGPAALLIGWFGESRANFTLPSLMNCAVIKLSARQEWCYELPTNHSLVWVFVVNGALATAEGEIAANKMLLLNGQDGKIALSASADAVFVVGSSQAFGHDLMARQDSVHTSLDAMKMGIHRLDELKASLGM